MWTKCLRSARRAAVVSLALTLSLTLFAGAGSAQTSAIATHPVSRLTQPIDNSQRVKLLGTVHPLANAANDRGLADAGTPLERIQVTLKRSAAQESALRQLLQDMHTPGTASYHKWLTPEQFGEQFGPTDEDIATLSSWLTSQGFTVGKVNAGKQTMEISATAGVFQKAFGASIHKYQVNGQMHFANSADPQIPAALAPVFGGFASLNNFPMKSQMKKMGTAMFNPATHKVTPNWSEGTNGVYLIVAPGDFAVQYDLNPLYSAATPVKGTGQTIGIINEANVNPALVAQYRSLFGLPANPLNVIIDGNDPGIDGVNNPDGENGASGEAYLDVEISGAVAPNAQIDLIIGADTALSSGLSLAAEHAVYGDVAPVLSISFLSCETSGSSFWEGLWQQAAAQGQTVMVSAGDAGAAGCDDDNTQEYAVDGQRVNGIASTPYNVAVGGTDFYYSSYNGTQNAQNAQLAQYWDLTASNRAATTSLLQVIPEQPWNDSQFGLNLYNEYANDGTTNIVGGGGGASNCATETSNKCTGGYAKPSWQVGTGVPADGVRDTPDVSLFAANGDNYSFYPTCVEDGDCQPAAAGSEIQITGVGGTSASSPAFAGIMALVNQLYGPQGQADFVLYPLFKQYPAAFHDVVNGTNSVPCAITKPTNASAASPNCIAVTSPATVTDPYYGKATEGQIGTGTTAEYNAGTGYDLASGLGSVDANVLVTDWNKVTFAASTVTLTPSATTFAHGTAITISGTVTPTTAAGNVSLETTSTEPLNAGEVTFAVSGGTYNGTVDYLPGGTYQIYGLYGGDGTNGPSSSAKTTITVTPEASATALYAMNEAASSPSNAFASGSTISYGTQIVLEAFPGSVKAANTTTAPTGTVQFLNGTTVIGTATLNAQGEASLNYAPVPSSTAYSITAVYSGDASYATSTSTAFTFTVAQDKPTLALGSSTQTTATITAVSGESALSVSVENNANLALYNKYGPYFVAPAVAPTGVVTVSGLPSGTLTFPALSSATDPITNFIEGVGTVALPAETAGTYTVTISYPGDANYAATTATASVTITTSSLIPTTTTATTSVSSTTSTTAEAVTFTVTGTTAGGFPTGNVNFILSGENIGYLTLPTSGSGDSVTETLNLDGYLLTGGNQITVQYDGSTVYAPSQAVVTISNGGTAPAPGIALNYSGGITETAGNSGTATISVTPIGGFTGSVALTCAVTPTSGTSVPTCTITTPVTISGTSAATATLTVASTSTTTTGAYTVTVTGTASAVTAATTSLALTVNGGGTQTPTVALSNSGGITIGTPGGSGTSTITATLGGGLAASGVSLSCSVSGGTTDTPTCSVGALSPATATTTATATLTVNTTGASGALAFPKMGLAPIGGGVALAGLLCLLLPSRRRRLGTLLGALVLMAFVGFAAGCGGGGSAPGNSGTPAGTYTVTVTGTASGATTATTSVSVTVN